LAGQTENAAAIENVKELYRFTKVPANQKFNPRKPIKDINGQLLKRTNKKVA
jgi:hypothetical protein